MMERLAQSTLRNMQDTASRFHEQMTTRTPEFDFAYQIIRTEDWQASQSGLLRATYPVWFVRQDTDYSGRPLDHTYRGEDKGYRGWLGAPEVDLTARKRIGVSASEGTIIVAAYEEGHTLPKTEDQILERRMRGLEGFQLPYDRSALATAEDLFDVKGTTPAGLQRIEQQWQHDLVAATHRYASRPGYGSVEVYERLSAVSVSPVGALHPGV